MEEAYFHETIEEWITHCRTAEVLFSSSSKPVRDCEAYRTIVAMGSEALPFIRQVYDRDRSKDDALGIVQLQGLVDLVSEIVGDDFQIPEEIQGNMPEIEEYTKRWLDKNIQRSVHHR